MSKDQGMNQPLVKTYVLASTPNPNLGCSGLPRAVPYIWELGERNIRHPSFACCFWTPGPNIPMHWFDGKSGWVSYFFTDVEPYNRETRKNGSHRCQARLPNGQLCEHTIQNDGCCNDSPCWCPYSPVIKMAAHLHSHGIRPPPTRQWASDLFDTPGCFDVWFCAPCQASRQMEALSGYADHFSFGWFAYFCCMGFRTKQVGGKAFVYWVPPHILGAILTRYSMVRLNNIEESFCATWCTVCWCAPCSLAQTYRELSASGVWPGGTCMNTEPPNVVLQPPMIPQMAGGGQQQGGPIQGVPIGKQV